MYKIETVSTEIPQDLQVRHLSGTVYEFIGHVGITEALDNKGNTVYHSTMTHITSHINSRDEMISALIRLRYTQDAEFALINKGILNAQDEDYVKYRNYVSLCKTKSNIVLTNI